MLKIWRYFGQYAVHTNLAKVNYRKSSVTSVSSQSMHRALMTSSSDSRNSLNQVALPIRANLPALSAPKMHGVLVRPLLSPAPMLSIMA